MKPKNEKRVKELLDRAETAISSKYKTKEELENAYARVLVMSQQFDKALNYMRNAALDYADGDISKGELYAVLREQKKIIKEPCQLLMIHLGQEFHKEDEIDMDDITVFRDYARGLDHIFKTKLKEAAKIEVNPNLADKVEEAFIHLYGYGRSFNDDSIAMESYSTQDIYPDHTRDELLSFATVCESLKIKPNESWIIEKLNSAKSNLYDKWGEDASHNILYITGYSGSGKSTITEKLKDSNTVVIHLDLYFDEYINPNAGGKSSLFGRFLEEKNIPAPNSLNDREKVDLDIYKKFERAIEEFGRLQFEEGRKVIVEGTQILDGLINPNKDFYKNKCIIILQTSQAKSKENAAKRDKKEAKELAEKIMNKHQDPSEQKKNMNELVHSSNAESGSIEVESAEESFSRSEYKAYNLDKWGKSPDTNILYITGHSGSGKSTIARKIASENKDTIVIHLDSYYEKSDSSNQSSDFNAYLKNHGINIPNSIDFKDWGKYKVLDKFESSAIEFGKEKFKEGKKVIVEGVQLSEESFIVDKNFFRSKPFIVMNAGFVKSAMRAASRDQISHPIKNAFDRKDEFINRAKGIKGMKKILEE